MNKNKIIVIIVSIGLSVGLSLLFPSNVGKTQQIDSVALSKEETIINQDITAITLDMYTITKVYNKDQLIGVLVDDEILANTIADQQKQLTEQNLQGYEINLDSNIYTTKENTFWVYEDKDAEIINYLVDHNYFVVNAVKIEIMKNNEVSSTIFVKSEDDFYAALKKFTLNFVDEGTFNKLDQNQTIEELSTYGTQDVNVYIEQIIKATKQGAPIDSIYASTDEIFNYLCYGKDYVLDYYTVQEFDTVAGIASQHGLSAKQLMSINPEIIYEDQTLVVGQQLNITYFNSPITVVVESQSYVKEVTYPGNADYIKDETLEIGEIQVNREAVNGYNDSLYTEIYSNGTLSAYRKEKTTVIAEPITAIYRVGSGSASYQGGISFILPCDNPAISCNYYCYKGHSGTDFINIYDRWGPIYAVTDGVVVQNGWSKDAGNYYRINAGTDINGNSIALRYGHMRVKGYFAVDTQVYQGMIIGQIGNTGRSSGPHVHISVYINGIQVNPCIYLPCELARNW